MKAVFRHELSSYFTGLTGYVFGTFVLLFAGIYTMVYNIDGAMVNYEYAVGSMTLVFIIAVPILTMRVISEERRSKTDQLLYALPLTMTKVVLGKFGALLAVLLVPTCFMALYPLLLSGYGAVSLPTSYATLFGFFLLGGALLSIGMFLSSLTESQAMAAGICFVVMLLNYFLTGLVSYLGTSAFASWMGFAVVVLLAGVLVWRMTGNGFVAAALTVAAEGALGFLYLSDPVSFAGKFPTLMEKLSLFERFDTFVYGILDLRSAVYLMSVSGFFLFLTVQSMEKRRWSE